MARTISIPDLSIVGLTAKPSAPSVSSEAEFITSTTPADGTLVRASLTVSIGYSLTNIGDGTATALIQWTNNGGTSWNNLYNDTRSIIGTTLHNLAVEIHPVSNAIAGEFRFKLTGSATYNTTGLSTVAINSLSSSLLTGAGGVSMVMI